MESLFKKIREATEHFITEKEIRFFNGAYYVAIYSSENSGFARKISYSDSPRTKQLFFEAIKEYDKLCNKEA